MTYIDWDISVRVMEDGSEQPFSTDTYGNDSELSGTYRFSGTIPEEIGTGNLLFETDGLSLTLSLNGTVIWQSESTDAGKTLFMSQGSVPLPEGTSGELEATCEILDSSQAMFPPLIRFVPENLDIIESTALANRAAFPSGAAALALILVFGIFLLSIRMQSPDFSLIPLFFALAGLLLTQLMQAEGGYFLPRSVADLLARREISFLVPVLLLVYLALNRKRKFWKYFGIACAWSIGAFLLCYLVSWISGGSLALYINGTLLPGLKAGYYGGALYWLSLWLSFTAALISAYGVLQVFSEHRALEQALILRNRLVTENYHTLQKRMEADAAVRHEFRHQLTALELLCQKEDLAGIRELLDQLNKDKELRATTDFTSNQTVNTILQYTSGRAARSGVRLDTDIHIPKDLNLPEGDLCSLLMNMLDNALEAASGVPSEEEPYISLRLGINGAYFTIRCENSFHNVLKKDKDGNLLTTKPDPQVHGYGLRQMEDIARKYHSSLRIRTENDRIFILMAALRLPE